MSFKLNVFANYACNAFVTLAGIVTVPIYLHYLGVEAYGLIGLFAVIQAAFQFLDMGLTPTMSRETARYTGGAIDIRHLRRLLRVLEVTFTVAGVLAAVGILLASATITARWIRVESLAVTEVQTAIALMGVVVALRWTGGLYRGIVIGFERIIWLSGFDVLLATARIVLVIPVLMYVAASPVTFFCYQAVVALAELIVLGWKAYCLLPAVRGAQSSWRWAPLRESLKFSLGVAFTGAVWMLLTNADKIVLSRLLSLHDYGYFTLAVVLASGVNLITAPVGIALQPRLTKLAAMGDDAGFIALYHGATQIVGVVVIAAAVVIAFFAEPVLLAWTGDQHAAQRAAPVLALYAIGNCLVALCAFPKFLQYAKGNLRLHLIGHVLFVVILIPSLIWATWRYGMVGAGFAWLFGNAAYLLCWIPFVHRRFYPDLHARWLKDIAAIGLFTVTGALVAQSLIAWSPDRGALAAEIVLVSAALLAVAAASSRQVLMLLFTQLMFVVRRSLRR